MATRLDKLTEESLLLASVVNTPASVSVLKPQYDSRWWNNAKTMERRLSRYTDSTHRSRNTSLDAYQPTHQSRALFTAHVSDCASCGSVHRRLMTSEKVGRGDEYDVTLLRFSVWRAVEKFLTPNRRNESVVFWRICYDRCTMIFFVLSVLCVLCSFFLCLLSVLSFCKRRPCDLFFFYSRYFWTVGVFTGYLHSVAGLAVTCTWMGGA